MSYKAEEQIWFDEDKPITFYGFFLFYGEWEFEIFPFPDIEGRNYVVEYPMKQWGMGIEDALDTGALMSAYAESDVDEYLDAALDIMANYGYHESHFDEYIQKTYDLVVEGGIEPVQVLRERERDHEPQSEEDN
jgi:hypothetical protein